jgi:D-galactose 1-dehydrogenase
MAAWRIGVIGLGKIAQDQHLPVIAANPDFVVVAVSSQRGLTVPGVAHAMRTPEALLALPEVDAVAICTPPQVRHAIARAALAAGKHVLLEKPPAATLTELADLERLAQQASRVLFTTWHSQYNAAVERAAELLAGQVVIRLFVNWKEDVRKWHPGQTWIFEAGGFGVLDPGINAMSIVTRIMPQPAVVRAAELSFPANADAPIAVAITFEGADHRAELDWRQQGGEVWEIELATQSGQTLKLAGGGRRLEVDGAVLVDEPAAEYEGIYRHFATLLGEGRSHVDAAPFRLVADAFMLGRRLEVAAFYP